MRPSPISIAAVVGGVEERATSREASVRRETWAD